ncbi:MAG: hypothetical protein ACE5R6_09810 [Candidatus Heimdallarchaeota archaeon]
MSLVKFVQEKPMTITPHKPDFKERLFFFISGIIISVPFTLLVGTLTRALCVLMTVFLASVCATTLFTPLIEEFAKVYPLFYRHGETEKSLFSLGFWWGWALASRNFSYMSWS